MKQRIEDAVREIADADGTLRAAMMASEQAQAAAIKQASQALARAQAHLKAPKRR